MTASWRLVASVTVGVLLPIVLAPACILLGIGAAGWIAVSMGVGLIWALMQNRIFDKVEAACTELESSTARDGDGAALLALFAMHSGPVRLFDLVIVLSPPPDPPSWLHPLRRWNVMIAWVRRNSEVVAEAGRLSRAGLLRRTERSRRWDDMSVYEITGLGRDVAARNAEVLMASPTEERA